MPLALRRLGNSLGGPIRYLKRRRPLWSRRDPATDGDSRTHGIQDVRGTGDSAIPGNGSADTPALTWSDDRIAFCRRLWGDDAEDTSIEPGGSAYYRELLQAAAISSSKVTLDLSASLGGGLRHMADKLNLWMTGMEADPELAKRAMALSVKQKLAKKAPVSNYDPAKLDLPKDKYHAVIMRERLHRVASKADMLKTIQASLKADGYFVLTDFALPNESARTAKSVTSWLDLQNDPITLWTTEDYKQALSELDFKPSIFQDESAQYRALILRGWARLVSGLERPELTRAFVDTMMREATYWVRLERALARGELIYLHTLCVARKPKPKPA
jgi:cyclopropane fatty-acyl-phospholipid synthase-like methyltransferase